MLKKASTDSIRELVDGGEAKIGDEAMMNNISSTDSRRVNFFILSSPSLGASKSSRYITSYP